MLTPTHKNIQTICAQLKDCHDRDSISKILVEHQWEFCTLYGKTIQERIELPELLSEKQAFYVSAHVGVLVQLMKDYDDEKFSLIMSCWPFGQMINGKTALHPNSLWECVRQIKEGQKFHIVESSDLSELSQKQRNINYNFELLKKLAPLCQDIDSGGIQCCALAECVLQSNIESFSILMGLGAKVNSQVMDMFLNIECRGAQTSELIKIAVENGFDFKNAVNDEGKSLAECALSQIPMIEASVFNMFFDLGLDVREAMPGGYSFIQEYERVWQDLGESFKQYRTHGEWARFEQRLVDLTIRADKVMLEGDVGAPAARINGEMTYKSLFKV